MAKTAEIKGNGEQKGKADPFSVDEIEMLYEKGLLLASK